MASAYRRGGVVDWPGFNSLVKSDPKTLTNGIYNFSGWRSARKEECPWITHLSEHPRITVTNRWRGQAVYPSWRPV